MDLMWRADRGRDWSCCHRERINWSHGKCLATVVHGLTIVAVVVV